MCKSKKKLGRDVINPKKKPKPPPSSRSMTANSSAAAASFGIGRSASSSTSRRNNQDSFLNTTSSSHNYFKDTSWQSSTSISVSSRTSLSSLRDSVLPEQPHFYDFSEIRSATNNFLLKPFSSSSSSTSWRCTIRTQNVLIFQRKFLRQMDVSEVIDRLTHICRSHHASLIKLKGASISGNYIYLVYDYIQGATLANCLRNKRNPSFSVLSTWMSRVQVASDVAHGLDYIHNSTGLGQYGFVHNHIKSTSIIVTEPSLAARICHFGTAELCGEMVEKMMNDGQMMRSENKFEGTIGYMAPEYQASGVSSQKADVYAFGVVILELLSGEEPLRYAFDEGSKGYVRKSVIDGAREAMRGGEVRRWVDKRLKDSFPVEVVEKMVRLGLECAADDPDERPGMGKVVGRISQLYLESQRWSEQMGTPVDLTVSLAPR